MQPRVRLGLIVGTVGAVLTICVATFMGICGPFVSMLAGAVAGFLTGQSEKADTKGDGARAGAISGAIAGAIIIVGQLLGAIGALIFLQQTGTKPIFGSIPSPNAPAEMQAVFYLTGAGTGLCFGLIGTALAALGGAGGGYFGTPDRPGSTPPANFQI